MFASPTGQVATVKLFLDRGVIVDARDDQGRTALFYAAGRGFPTITRLLLEKGADPNLADKFKKPRSTMRSRSTRCRWPIC